MISESGRSEAGSSGSGRNDIVSGISRMVISASANDQCECAGVPLVFYTSGLNDFLGKNVKAVDDLLGHWCSKPYKPEQKKVETAVLLCQLRVASGSVCLAIV